MSTSESTIVPRPKFSPYDVLAPSEVREALGIVSDSKWDDVRRRIPWSDRLGSRTLRIQWSALLTWLAEGTRRVA